MQKKTTKMNKSKFNLFAATGMVIALGTVAFTKIQANYAPTPTFYLHEDTQELRPLPGGAAGENLLWECIAGDQVCTYDENKQPIGSSNRKIVIME